MFVESIEILLRNNSVITEVNQIYTYMYVYA